MPATVSPVNGPDLVHLFDRLTADLVEALAGLDDWGLSGEKHGQYRHDVVAVEVLLGPLLAEGFHVLTEESDLVAGPTGSGITVVVDPVDGSTNASHGLPWYATSLCAVDDDGPLAASVTNLVTGQRFEAVRGEGARVDGGQAAPSAVTSLGDAFVAFSGLPPSHGGWRQYRAYGAGALDICAVATGVFDGFVDVDGAHGVWDYLGAALVCREAGAVMVDGGAEPLLTFDVDARRAPIAAANDELLAELVGMWRGWRAER